jgi:FAD/FMN-containing dehydrogenase
MSELITDLLDVADLELSVTGPVLVPGDPGLAAELAAFNTAHAPEPAVVVGATCSEDVAAAVRWASARGLSVAVQATGHGLVETLSGAVLITTRRMSDVTVDPVTRSARVGAGVVWRQVIDTAAPHGLAPLAGSSSGVGVVGYTLGGGVGPLGRRYGFAADHVRRARLVTPDGEIRDVDHRSDPELFWALRGGKGSFGIVTELEFGLVPVTGLHGGGLFFPGSAARDVLHAYRGWVATLPEETTTSVAILRLPPLPALPEVLRGRTVVHLRFAHLGPADDGAALLAPMRAVAPALIDTVADLPFAAADAIHMDPTDPLPAHERGTLLRELPAAAVDELLAAAGPEVELPLAIVELRHLGGALGRPAPVPNAVTGREAAFSCLVIGPMAAPVAGIVPGVVASVVDRLAPWSTGGSLLNFVGGRGAQQVAGLWGADDRARLLAVKRRLDPAGVLRHGHVIG